MNNEIIGRCFRSVGLLTSLAFASFTACQPAFAFDINVDVDSHTRAFIESLPALARQEAVKAMEEILPLVSRTANEILSRVDQLAEDRIRQGQCTLPIAADTADELRRKVGHAFAIFSRDNVVTTRPVETLEKLKSQQIARIGPKSDSAFVSAVYADIIIDAQKVECIVSLGTNSVPLDRVRSFEAELAPDGAVWNWLYPQKCSSVSSCFQAAHDRVDRLLRQADRRDIAANGADTAFAVIALPTAAPNGFGSLSQPFDIGIVNSELRKFRNIEILIYRSALRRANEAKRRMQAVVSKLDEAFAGKAHYVNCINTSKVSSSIESCWMALDAMNKNFDVSTDIVYAMASSDAVRKSAIAQGDRLRVLKSDLPELISLGICNKKNNDGRDC